MTSSTAILAARPTQDDYIVAFFDTHSWHSPIGPVRVHVEKGHTTKETQDRVAALMEADPRPHVIYFVMLEADFFAHYRNWLEERFVPEHLRTAV